MSPLPHGICSNLLKINKDSKIFRSFMKSQVANHNMPPHCTDRKQLNLFCYSDRSCLSSAQKGILRCFKRESDEDGDFFRERKKGMIGGRNRGWSGSNENEKKKKFKKRVGPNTTQPTNHRTSPHFL